MNCIFKFCIILLLIYPKTFSSAQMCQGFYKKSRCFVKESSDFKQYSQARSAAVVVGEPYKFAAVLYGNKDYIISVCTELGYKYVHFKIVDKTNSKVIYDNQEDNYINGIAFSVEKTMNIEIEVEVLYEKDKERDSEIYRVCVGVQMLWRKIPKLGFKS